MSKCNCPADDPHVGPRASLLACVTIGCQIVVAEVRGLVCGRLPFEIDGVSVPRWLTRRLLC